MSRIHLLCLMTCFMVNNCVAFFRDVFVLGDYEIEDVTIVGEYFNIRRCVSIEYPKSTLQIVQSNDYLVLHCSCFGEQYAPICPRWTFTRGEEYVNIEETQLDLSPNFCRSSLVIGANWGMTESIHNISIRCDIPHTGRIIPDFSFKIQGSRYSYSYVVTHHPLIFYGALCWLSSFLVLLMVQRKCFRRQKKTVQLYTLPEIELSMDKPGAKSGIATKHFPDSFYNFSIKMNGEKSMDADDHPLLDITTPKETK